MSKLFHAVTVPMTLGFLRGQAAYMRSHGFEVQAISSPGLELEEFGRSEGIETRAVPMMRRISPVPDLLSVVRLFLFFRRERPDIVHAHTPKASLLAMIAAWTARIPCRFFHIHGHPHSTATGVSRILLQWSTKISCLLATRVLCVSASALDIAVKEGLCSPSKAAVLARGSINGIDTVRKFVPRGREMQRRSLLGLTSSDLVIGFAGRLVRDKGVCELYESWQQIREEFPNAWLVIAGEPEERDALPSRILENLNSDSRVRMLGWLKEMDAFYESLDVLTLPSHREGLGLVILEAAALEVPAIAARSVGCVDAIIDGTTGLLVDVADSAALTNALRIYLSDPALRERHGRQARARVLEDFRPEDLWRATQEEYEFALHKATKSRRITGKSLNNPIQP